MTTVNDSHLAYLLSLGFDMDLCKQALTQNSTLENATEWILNPNQPPVLNLGLDLSVPSSSSSQLAFSPSMPHQDQNNDDKLVQKKKFETLANELKKDKQMERQARHIALLEIKEDQEKRRVKGLYNNNNATSTSSSNNVLTERQRIQLTIKKQKRLDQEQRQCILQNIRNDKKVRKLDSSSTTTTPPLVITQHHQGQEAFIQFKLTDASILRQKFHANTTIKELLEFILNKEIVFHQGISMDDVSLVSAFPRQTFTINDQLLSVKEAGFIPNVSLNVLVVLPTQEQVQQHQDEDMDEVDEGEGEDDDHMDEDVDSEFETMTSGGHRLTDKTPNNNNTTESDVVQEENTNQVDRRTHMLSAIEQRTTNNHQNTATTTTRGKQRYTKTLKETCCISVAGLLSQHTVSANRYLKKLVHVSSNVAEYLIAYLIKNEKLNGSTLRKLANHCYLQNILFDSYSYCTDSLIDDVCKSNSSASISKTSLGGCDVITDGAIRSLTGLKNLTCLDLNNCKVTDKGLKSLEKLHYLSYLNLSKTKISHAGIISMVSNAKFKLELQALLLDGCERVNSNAILVPIINDFTNLVQLSFAYTTIFPLNNNPPVQLLTNKSIQLEQLDVNHTFITDQDLITIVGQFKSLEELKLGGCEELTTRSLAFLPRELKNLKYIQFPNRQHELDGVLSRYKDLPIQHLDLTGFLNVTDEGVQHIASMNHLRYLSLDGTKVTDKGIMCISNLIQLEKLYLDRTLLTDVGIEKLIGLSKLETLSLCRTEVSNIGLSLLGDFEKTRFTRNIRTLNLAQCTLVTNKGILGLSGMFNLTHLNLDHTSVGKSCLKYLKDLQHLNTVRLQGIEKEDEDDTMDLAE